MRFFSPRKASITLALAATSVLAACGDDVTVQDPPVPQVVISITPSNQTANVGDVLTFAVQITGGSATTPPTLASCTSSNNSVATAAKDGNACKVTAVTPGNATVTAAASGGQQASAGISVTAQTAAISGLTLSPSTANLGLTTGSNTVTITPNVTKGAAANTVVYTYTTSSAAIASLGAVAANGSVVVTAVAPGTATITATAVGSGTGFRTETLTSAATVIVGNTTASVTGLTVTPNSLNLAVGTVQGLTATVTQPTVAPLPPTAVITYATSNAAVATVSTAGVVTGVAPGTATITVTATSAGNAAYAASTLTQPIPVTVNPLANVSIDRITQGPIVTTGLDSAFSGWDPAAASRTGIGPIGPALVAGGANGGTAQGVIAGIRSALNPQVDNVVDILNTKDQIKIAINLTPNGMAVDSVVAYIDPATATRRAAGRQIYSGSPNATNAPITIDINTADFTFVGDIGEVHYPNGPKSLAVSVWTTLPAGSSCNGTIVTAAGAKTCEIQQAGAVRSGYNFNNVDGFAMTFVKPANTALDATSRSWWGGPTTSDIGQQSGAGSFKVYPVMYTPGRSIIQLTATFGRCQGFGAGGVPNGVNKVGTPYLFSYGTAAPAAPAGATFIGCNGLTGSYDSSDQFRFEDFPMVVASLDNSQNPGPRSIYAYNPTLANDPFGGPRPTLFRIEPSKAPPQDPIRVDYAAPTITYSIPGPTNERWVNDTWAFNTGYTATDANVVGVGLFPTASRNTIFRYASANPGCGPQTYTDITGGLNATVVGMGSMAPNTIRESTCDFTNNAYVGQATETDRLGNRATTGSQTPAPGTPLYGVDNTAPDLTIAYDGGGPIPDMPNIYASTADSLFQPVNGAIPATPIAKTIGASIPVNLTDFVFGARYVDTRSGFNQDDHGTRTVTRWAPNATPLFSNVAVLSTVSTRTMNFDGGIGNPSESEDPAYRRDSVYIYGAGPIALTGTQGVAGSAATPSTATPASGYYQYQLTLRDRAGNTATLRERAVIDRTSPNVTGVLVPSVIGASGTAAAVAQTFIPTGDDDVEAWDADLYLRYPAMEMEGDGSIGSTAIVNGARVRFRHDRFANFHNVWQVFTDGLLATPFGPGAALSNAGLTLPIPTMRGIEPVDNQDAPIAWGVAPANPFTGFKPNEVGAYAFDPRATHRSADWIAPYNTDPAFYGLGQNIALQSSAPAVLDGESARQNPIFPGIVSIGARWDTKDLNTNTPGLDRLVGWFGFGTTGATIEFRATTSTIVTQPPFPNVHLFRWETDAGHTGSGETPATGTFLADSARGQWVYVGTLAANAPTNPILFENGATRFWRYIFTAGAFPSVTNGRIIQPGVAVGCYRAVGVDASGDGITTRSFGAGCPAAGAGTGTLTTIAAGTLSTVTLRAYGNQSGTITTDIAPAFTLNKSSATGVERVSQNRAAAVHTWTFTPGAGASIEKAPQGCTLVGAPVFPSAIPVQCTLNVTAPTTITVIFDNP